MQNLYKKYLNSHKTKSNFLSNRRQKKRKNLKSVLNDLNKSYWKTVKNANLAELFNLGLLTGNRIKFKELPILLILIIYECVQLAFRNKLPYLVFLIIILQSTIYLKNTTDLFEQNLEFLKFKKTPILSLEILRNTKFISINFFKLILFNNLVHLNDLHLYISLINFLWKGSQLEIIFGRIKFTFILIIFLILVNLTFMSLNSLFYFSTLNDYFFKNQMSGFTSITFALKVCFIFYEREFRIKTNKNLKLSNPQQFRSESEENLIKEIILEACIVQTPIWFEFLCLYFFLPKITILNHLSGILVGYIYVKTKFLKNSIDYLVIYLIGLFNFNKRTKDSHLESNRIDSPSLGKIIINNKVQLCLDQLRLKKTYYFE